MAEHCNKAYRGDVCEGVCRAAALFMSADSWPIDCLADEVTIKVTAAVDEGYNYEAAERLAMEGFNKRCPVAI